MTLTFTSERELQVLTHRMLGTIASFDIMYGWHKQQLGSWAIKDKAATFCTKGSDLHFWT